MNDSVMFACLGVFLLGGIALLKYILKNAENSNPEGIETPFKKSLRKVLEWFAP